MLEASYKDNETNFLEEIANKLNLKDKTRLVFIERLRIDNDHLNNPALATCLSQSLLKDTSQKATSKIILRDSLKTIFKKLNREGCDFHGVTREKVKIAKQWLQFNTMGSDGKGAMAYILYIDLRSSLTMTSTIC